MTPAWHPTGAQRRRRITYSRGYRITMGTINVLFAVVLLPVAAILGGPIAYGLGV